MNAIEFVKDRIRNIQTLLLIKGDLKAQRVLIAWTFYGILPKAAFNSSVGKEESPAKVLSDLWKLTGPIDMKRLADLSDVPESKVKRIFWRLKEAALIWPDGTLSMTAQQIVTAESNAYIGDLISREKRAR